MKLSSSLILTLPFIVSLAACGKRRQDSGSVENVTPQFRQSANESVAEPWATAQGGDSSGGGPSIVCRKADKSIESVRLLDLFEGQILDGITLSEQNNSLDEWIAATSTRLGEVNIFLKYDFDDAMTYVRSHQRFLPEGVFINPGNDLGSDHAIPVPEGCQVEFVGFYETTGELKISKSLLDRLSIRDRAAFYVHESLYKVVRMRSHAKDSQSTRKLNAQLFSERPTPSSLKNLVIPFLWDNLQPLLIDNKGRNSEFQLEVSQAKGSGEGVRLTGVTFACYQREDIDSAYSDSLSFLYGYKDPDTSFANMTLKLSAKDCPRLKVATFFTSGTMEGGHATFSYHIKLSLNNQVIREENISGTDTNLPVFSFDAPLYIQR